MSSIEAHHAIERKKIKLFNDMHKFPKKQFQESSGIFQIFSFTFFKAYKVPTLVHQIGNTKKLPESGRLTLQVDLKMGHSNVLSTTVDFVELGLTHDTRAEQKSGEVARTEVF